MKKKCNKTKLKEALRKLQNGGNLETAQGVAGAVSAIGGATGIPGVGQALDLMLKPLLGAIGDADNLNNTVESYKQIQNQTQPFKNGGNLKNSKEDFYNYNGNEHSEGGITASSDGLPTGINPEIEIENEESAVNFTNLDGENINYVFSKSLKI